MSEDEIKSEKVTNKRPTAAARALARQAQVVECVISGMKNGAMAKKLGVTERTIARDIVVLSKNYTLDKLETEAKERADYLFRMALEEAMVAKKLGDKELQLKWGYLSNQTVNTLIRFMEYKAKSNQTVNNIQVNSMVGMKITARELIEQAEKKVSPLENKE